MKKVHLITIVASIICVLITVSCGQKSVDKSQYEFVTLKDERLGSIIDPSEPNANETKLFASHVEYHELSEFLKTMMGLDENDVGFADSDTSGIKIFTIKKGRLPVLTEGQKVIIYFRQVRKKGEVVKAEIDLIEQMKDNEKVSAGDSAVDNDVKN